MIKYLKTKFQFAKCYFILFPHDKIVR